MATGNIQIKRQPSRHTPGGIGIVHLGLGAFHRAHQVVYIQRYLNLLYADRDSEWGICSANIRSNYGLVDQLRKQQLRYHVAELSSRKHVVLREITAIREALYAGPDGPDREALLTRLSDSGVRIVMLTVTEKGYFLSPNGGEILAHEEPIAHDIVEPESPHTAPGILVEALARRRAKNIEPFTVICCDNMPNNGSRVRRAVVSLAHYRSTELADWIEAKVAFPSSMVDRIVPSMADADHVYLKSIGVDDSAAVICEEFSQWVIEDKFTLGRPGWEIVNVEMVADISQFETMKLRLLNGAHSLIAYLGILDGIDTVASAMGRDDLVLFIKRYMLDEVAPTLVMPEGADLGRYVELLLDRFTNNSLHHNLEQIAKDGSQKLPQRWLNGAHERLVAGEEVPCTMLGVAAWIRYFSGVDLCGNSHVVNDPLVNHLSNLHARYGDDVRVLVSKFLAIEAVFPPALSSEPRFEEGVCSAYIILMQQGLAAALSDLKRV